MASNADNVSIWWRHHVASRDWSFLRYRYGSITKSLLKRLYVLNIGFAWMLWRFVNHDEMNLFLIAFLQSLANSLSISVMSNSRSLAYFRTAVARVVKPWWFNCTSSKNTFFASSLSGIWYNRLICRNADIWHEVLGGSLPHSPTVIILLVVALTCKMHRENWRNALSTVPQRVDLKPHTSLPYVRMGFIRASKRLNIISGGRCPMVFILQFILNKAFRAWSQRNA